MIFAVLLIYVRLFIERAYSYNALLHTILGFLAYSIMLKILAYSYRSGVDLIVDFLWPNFCQADIFHFDFNNASKSLMLFESNNSSVGFMKISLLIFSSDICILGSYEIIQARNDLVLAIIKKWPLNCQHKRKQISQKLTEKIQSDG